VTRLVQCSKVRTIEGIGTQVTGTAHMRATLFGNTEANNGNGTANMDSLFVDPAEQGTLVETIDHNVYKTGIGGASTNGFEYIVSNGNGTSSVTISNSFFQNNPGDMLQELNFGAGATATMTLDHVTVEQTTIARGLPPYAEPPGTLTGATNTGDCLDIVANGANDTTIFTMTDSSFTGCDNNGIEITSNHATGNGVGDIHTRVRRPQDARRVDPAGVVRVKMDRHADLVAERLGRQPDRVERSAQVMRELCANLAEVAPRARIFNSSSSIFWLRSPSRNNETDGNL